MTSVSHVHHVDLWILYIDGKWQMLCTISSGINVLITVVDYFANRALKAIQNPGEFPKHI